VHVGFIGVGNIGAPMARRLVSAGHEVHAYDIRRDVAEAVVGAPNVASSPIDLLEGSDVIVTMLPSGGALEEMVLGLEGLELAWPPGLVFLDMGTTSPDLSRLLAEAVQARNGRYLEAPVSGGTAGAKSGTLTIIAAGDRASFDRLRPLFDALGERIFFVGSPGAAQTLKLANNLLLAVNVVSVGEAWSLVNASGIDPQVGFEVLTACSGDSRALRTRVPAPDLVPGYPPADGYRPGFTVALMMKDMALVAELSKELGLSTPTLDAARAEYARAVADGFTQSDIAIVAARMRDQVV
jgi:3-hydroxyisobutyrate dehydrogenase